MDLGPFLDSIELALGFFFCLLHLLFALDLVKQNDRKLAITLNNTIKGTHIYVLLFSSSSPGIGFSSVNCCIIIFNMDRMLNVPTATTPFFLRQTIPFFTLLS
jgi:hypothetical protein